jgi:hypothetical protein
LFHLKKDKEMKFLKRIIIVMVAWLAMSCDATELDLTVDPNNANEGQAGVQFLYNSVFGSFIATYQAAHFYADGPARMVNFGASTYREGIGPGSLNALWSVVYAGMFPDVDALVALAEDRDLHIHNGTAKIMKAYALIVLVDLIGDIPYSEAGGGVEVIAPNSDTGASVYAAAEALLDEAIGLLAQTANRPDFEPFYDGDPIKWTRFANTLKMKIYLTTRLVDSQAGAKFQAILTGGNFISSSADDFQFNYGTERNNPNSRHPFYNNSYESNDGTYMSTYYMWLLFSEKRMTDGARTPYESGSGDIAVDPRLRFYFYRQNTNLENKDPNIWECVYDLTPFVNNNDGALNPPPAHYAAVDPDMPYCIVDAAGFFGRDHGNGEGIPPDGPFRTVYGLYPGGGRFDDNSGEGTQNLGTDGAQGAGIDPIMLASFVDFMRAEMAQVGATAENPRTMMLNGVTKSLAKVRSFRSLVDLTLVVVPAQGSNPAITLGQSLLNNSNLNANDSAYMVQVAQIYDNAGNYTNGITTDALDVIMKEYLIALWGNGYEAYNNIRRTGRPFNHQPMLDTAPGSFVYSCFYPSNHVNFNPNAVQKPDLTQKVFWDTNGDIVR